MQSPYQKQQILKPKTAQIRNRNELLTTEPLTDRGLTEGECQALCTSTLIPLRERAFFRGIYESLLRPIELLNAQIENFNKDTGEIIALRTKGKKNRYIPETIRKPRHVFVSPATIILFKALISTRKRGFIFEGENGNHISKRYMQQQIDKYAKLLSIQKIRRYAQSKKNPEDIRVLPMVTLMALRKAGERHHDAGGGDSSLSAQAAGHTMKTKVKYYQGEQDWESVHKSNTKHHPAWKW